MSERSTEQDSIPSDYDFTSQDPAIEEAFYAAFNSSEAVPFYFRELVGRDLANFRELYGYLHAHHPELARKIPQMTYPEIRAIFKADYDKQRGPKADAPANEVTETAKPPSDADGPTMEGFFFASRKPYKFAPMQWRLLRALWNAGSVSTCTIAQKVYEGEYEIEGRLRKLVSDTNKRFLMYKLRFEIISPMPAYYALQVLPPVTPGVTEK